MKTFLVTYLEAVLKNEKQREIFQKKLEKNVENIISSQSESMISRVFNDFPAQKSADTDVLPFDLEFVDRAAKLFRQVVANEKSILMHKNNQNLIIDTKVHDSIKNLVNDLLIMGCQEMLDNTGEIKHEIVRIMSLSKLFRAWKNDKEKYNRIVPHLLIGYIVQCLMGAMIHRSLTSNPMSDNEVYRSGYVTKIMQDLLGNGLDPEVLKKIENYNHFYNKPLFENFAINLVQTDISQEKILKLITQDIPLLRYPGQLASDWQKDKIIFWKSVAAYLKDNKKIELGAEIAEKVTEIEMEQNKIRETEATTSYLSSGISMLTSSVSSFFYPRIETPKPQKIDMLGQYPLLRKWLNARDNSLIVSVVLHQVGSQNVRVLPEEAWLIEKLEKSRFGDLSKSIFYVSSLAQAPVTFLNEYHAACAENSALKYLLKQFTEEMTKAEIPRPQNVLKAEESSKILHRA